MGVGKSRQKKFQVLSNGYIQGLEKNKFTTSNHPQENHVTWEESRD